MKKRLLSLLFFCALMVGANAQIFVNANVIGGTNDGTSWANAYSDLQDAIADACGGGGTEIWVAQGTYYPSVGVDFDDPANGIEAREVTFQLCEGVKLYGGFTSGQMNLTDRDPNPATNGTVLSGDIGTPNNNADNAYHVVYTTGVTAATVLDGFTISAGNANASDNNRLGGGMSNFSSSPTITNTTFSGNTANTFGGGMYNRSSSPNITNTTFTGNTANNFGAGMSNFSSSPTITNSIIWNNQDFDGLGTANASIYNLSNSSPIITYSLVQNITTDNMNGNKAGDPSMSNYPAFVTPVDPTTAPTTAGNLRLLPSSPAINMGNNAAPGLAGITTDLDLNDRIFFNIVDMGAYEVGCDDFTFTNQVAYVDADATGGNKDGSNWTNAFTDLQDALSVACNCPGKVTEIWVAQGTYYPDEGFGQTNNARASTFQLCNGVALYGGFSGG